MYARADRGGTFYWENTQTREQGSLRTKDRKKAKELLHARNQAVAQPLMNRELGRAYLSASDPKLVTRTWQDAINAYCAREMRGSSLQRCQRAYASKHFDSIRKIVITETRPEDFLALLSNVNKVSIHCFLRYLHNFAVGLGWLPWAVLAPKAWPKIACKKRRAVTEEEHRQIIETESNQERRLFYDMLWHTGGSQTDVAELTAECIDHQNQNLVFQRKKLKTDAAPCVLRIGPAMAQLLAQLPQTGPLFPKLREIPSNLRASEFHRRCHILKIHGISLHSYRHAWAQRAKKAGMPERYAQEALGHASKAVHRAYANGAAVAVPSIEQYESAKPTNVIPFSSTPAPAAPAEKTTVTPTTEQWQQLQ